MLSLDELLTRATWKTPKHIRMQEEVVEKQVWRLQRWSNQEEGKKVEEKVFKNDREEAVMVDVEV